MEAIFHKVASMKVIPAKNYDVTSSLKGKFQMVILYDSDNRRLGEVVLHMKRDCPELRANEDA